MVRHAGVPIPAAGWFGWSPTPLGFVMLITICCVGDRRGIIDSSVIGAGGTGAMNCPQCGGALPDGASLCPECGAPVVQARSNHAPQPLDSEVSVPLAQANLLRLRRNYDLATAKCVEVLRKYPNNASAHSLLGDVYRDQGLYSEALGWYKLAIQLDPADIADRQKIEALEAELRSQQEKPRADGPIWRRVFEAARAKVPFGLMLGLMLGCIVLGALIALSLSRGATSLQTPPGIRTPRVLDSGVSVRAEPDQPRRRPEESQPRTTAAAPPEPIVYSSGREPAPAPATPPINPADKGRALLESLRSAADAEGLMVAVDSVAIDPRDGGATLGITVRDAVASADNRGLVLAKCLRMAELALAQDSALTRITLRCSAPMPDEAGVQQEKLVFVGDIMPSALKAAAGRNLTIDDALGLFTGAPWWHPRMRPPA